MQNVTDVPGVRCEVLTPTCGGIASSSDEGITERMAHHVEQSSDHLAVVVLLLAAWYMCCIQFCYDSSSDLCSWPAGVDRSVRLQQIVG